MFEVSKTSVNMAEARGLKAETTEKGGFNVFLVTKDGKPVFQYEVREDSLANPIQFLDADIHQGIPALITDDATLREFLRNWPLLSGKSDEE